MENTGTLPQGRGHHAWDPRQVRAVRATSHSEHPHPPPSPILLIIVYYQYTIDNNGWVYFDKCAQKNLPSVIFGAWLRDKHHFRGPSLSQRFPGNLGCSIRARTTQREAVTPDIWVPGGDKVPEPAQDSASPGGCSALRSGVSVSSSLQWGL